MKPAIIMGTRPEIIKLAPVIKCLGRRRHYTVFTGQHKDYNMGRLFMRQLGLPEPGYSIAPRGGPAARTGHMIQGLARILEEDRPDAVVVQGDTDTVLAGAVAAVRCGIPVFHVEAGLRSRDWRMPEEYNRVAVDHLSEMLFAPTKSARSNLTSEGVHGRIVITGNTAIDAVNMYAGAAKSGRPGKILLTLHRQENVDDRRILNSILRGIVMSGEEVVFPVHPRTADRLQRFGLYKMLERAPNVELLDAQGYLEMLGLLQGCLFVVTDSGGLQEEATAPAIRKRVLVLRKSSDRPEGLGDLSTLVGLSDTAVSRAIREAAQNPRLASRSYPYGRGGAGARIARFLGA
ncbi:UDP-N-acetylglucosamine 2-epimerase [Cenarchaeum symbiosum A]|uniref:UDP-N-acetylglucosamine 2-epimerase n=1 Tax=Cenarchaeum symbiosum (strain A) TaxID=414004 RepID=A0RWA9_CENSY|nr:UDP-N-acetylglucosamine 2-epimerase [Cenarchaeum symbiosum A]